MPRKSTSELLAEIANLLADNTAGLISPLDLRTCLNDICESFTSAFGGFRRIASIPVNVSPTFAKLTVFDEVVVTSPELVVSIANDTITAEMPAGSVLLFNFTASIAGSNNSDIQVELRRNGLPTLWRALSTTTGTANRVEITLQGYTQVTAPGDEFSIYVATLSGTDNADFFDTQLLLQTVQT